MKSNISFLDISKALKDTRDEYEGWVSMKLFRFNKVSIIEQLAKKKFQETKPKGKICGTVPPTFIFTFYPDSFTRIPQPIYSITELLYSLY